jgi:pimeloyl-ACP methyl ester carboxylesterase
MAPATVVLVPAGSAGSWTWHLVVDELRARGIDTLTPDLPTTGAPDNNTGPDDDFAVMQTLLDQGRGPFVLVGNSYGGWVITGVANERSDVAHLVYVSALMPDANEPMIPQLLASMVPGDQLGVEILPDGRLMFDVEADLRASFNLAPTEEVEFVRQHWGKSWSYGNRPAVLDRVAWETTPSTYVVCTRDRAVLLDKRREWAKRATHAVELDGDHCPQHSRPKELADILERIARGEG